MAKSTPHPYVPSSGPLVQTFNQFRKAMPVNVDSGTLKKLSLAPNNEPMVLSVLRFLGLIDNDGKKTPEATKLFTKHGDDAFSKALEAIVKKAYSDLFEHYGDDTWKSERDTLIAFFRATDETSAITGKRQAVAFETLSALSGHGEVSEPKSTGKRTAKAAAKKKVDKKKSNTKKEKESQGEVITEFSGDSSNIGLTVRIEINLPAQGDQETYDRIFKSIKKNLLNG